MVLKDSSGAPITCSDWDDLCVTFLGEGRNRYWLTYIVFTDGTFFFGQNGSTGAIDYGGPNNNGGISGADADDVIQACIDAVEATGGGGIVGIKEGTYPTDETITIEGDGIGLIGLNKYNASIIDPGNAVNPVIRVGDGVSDAWSNYLMDLFLDGPGEANGTTAIQLRTPNRGYYARIRMEDFSVGLHVASIDTAAFNVYVQMKTSHCMTGILMDGTGGNNANTFIGCDLVGWGSKPAGSIGVDLDEGNSNNFYALSCQGFETGLDLDDADGNIFNGLRLENITDGIIVAGDKNTWLAGNYSTITGTKWTDTGTDNISRHVSGLTTENHGTAQIANPNTTVVVAHGLEVTPLANDFSIIPTNNLGNASHWWISAVGAANFTINIDVAPGGGNTADFVWNVEMFRG